MRALEIRRNALGPSHRLVAQSLNHLAALNESIGEYAKAETMLVQARDIRKATLGERHSLYAITLQNLASLYYRAGKLDKAEPLLIEANKIWKETRGEKHPQYAQSLHNLASVYDALQRLKEAEPLYRQAGAILKEAYGEAHPEYATNRINLGTLHLLQGEFDRAEPLLVQAREIRQNALGTRHPDCGWAINTLGRLYAIKGDDARARTLHREALTSLLQAAGAILPSLSEAEALAWLKKHQPRPDHILSDARRTVDSNHAAVYQAVWETRSLAARLLAGRRVGSNASNESRRLHGALAQARKRLAQLTLATPPAGQRDLYASATAQANENKEQLEKQLAAESRSAAQSILIRDATVRQLMQSPAGQRGDRGHRAIAVLSTASEQARRRASCNEFRSSLGTPI